MRPAPQAQVVPAGGTARFDQGVFLMHLNRGRKLMEAQRLDEARAELEQALELRPRDEMTLNLLGMIYFRLDMRLEAAAVYRWLLEVHPEADVLHSNLGVLEFKDARYDDARRRLETALLLNPKNLRPHLYLGLIERMLGNLPACLDHLEAAGATDLLDRLRRRDGAAGDGDAGAAGDEADTGPMRLIDQESPAGPDAPDLALALDGERSPAAREGRDATFAIRRSGTARETQTLEIVFSRDIRVRAGRAISLVASAGSLHVAPPDPEGMIALRGGGRIALAPPGGGAGRVLLIELTGDLYIQAAPGRVLAHESGVVAHCDSGGGDLSRLLGRILTGAVRLSGEGIAALWCGPAARALALSGDDVLLAHPRDIVCWTGNLRARPASTLRLDQILAAGGEGAVTLEGAGEVVVDAPAR